MIPQLFLTVVHGSNLKQMLSEVVVVRIDRNRKLPATVLVRALGWDMNESIPRPLLEWSN